MSNLRPRPTPTTKPPSTPKTPNTTTNTDPDDTPKPQLQRQQSLSQRAISQTLSTTATLANLLPTGTLMAFQLLIPVFTQNGTCDSATRPMTLVLLVILALSCFLACFTDTIKASDGQVYHGLATFKGLWLFDYPGTETQGLPDLSDLDCSRGCSIVYYRDSVHYSWSSASDSFLTKILSETLVPVDAIKLSISTLQVVVAPILLGAYIQSAFPAVVKIVTPFAPLFAVLASSLLACSVFSENVVLLNSMVGASLTSDLSPLRQAQAILSGELGVVMLAVALVHYVGFFVGYISAAICGFKEPQRRSISIEVGMQNSSLGVVLATSHFSSPMVAVPPAVSAVVMNVMGSSLGFLWRYKNPSDSESSPKIDDK